MQFDELFKFIYYSQFTKTQTFIKTVNNNIRTYQMKIVVPPPIKKPNPCPQAFPLPEIVFPKLGRQSIPKTQSSNTILYNRNDQNENSYNHRTPVNEKKVSYLHEEYISTKKDHTQKQNRIFQNINAVQAQSNEVLPIESIPRLPYDDGHSEHSRKSNNSSQHHFEQNQHIHLHQTAKFNSFQAVSFRGSDLKSGFNPESHLNQNNQTIDKTQTKRMSRQQSIGQIRSPRNNHNPLSLISMQSPKSQNNSQFVIQSPQINSPQLQLQSSQLQSPKASQILQAEMQSPRAFSPTTPTIPQMFFLAPRNYQIQQNTQNYHIQNQYQQQQISRHTLPTNTTHYPPPMYRNHPPNQIVSLPQQETQIVVASPTPVVNPRFQQNMQNYVQYHQSRLKQMQQQNQPQNQIQSTNQKPMASNVTSIQQEKLNKSRPTTPVTLRGRSRNKSRNSLVRNNRSNTQNSVEKTSPNVSAAHSRVIEQQPNIQNQQLLRQKIQLQDKFRFLVQQFDQYRLQRQQEIRKLRNQVQSYQLRQRSMEEQIYYLQRQRQDKDRRLQQLSLILKRMDQDFRMRSR